MQKLCDKINSPLLNMKKYAAYEEGRNEPDIRTLKVLADYYNTTIDALCYENNQNI